MILIVFFYSIRLTNSKYKEEMIIEGGGSAHISLGEFSSCRLVKRLDPLCYGGGILINTISL